LFKSAGQEVARMRKLDEMMKGTYEAGLAMLIPATNRLPAVTGGGVGKGSDFPNPPPVPA